jgi:hypothetical protein
MRIPRLIPVLLLAATPVALYAPPLVIRPVFRTSSVTCKIALDSHLRDCSLNPGKTLDDAVDEAWQDYMNVVDGDEGADDSE